MEIDYVYTNILVFRALYQVIELIVSSFASPFFIFFSAP